MSLSYIVYCKEVSANRVPKLMKRLNDYDMVAEVHPDFQFDREADAGFLPFKFQLKNPHQDFLRGKELKSGFEFYIDDFDLGEEKESLQPKPGFFDRLRGKKPVEVAFAPPEMEHRLKDCKKAVSFVWHAGDSFQFRFASLTSAILTELTGGICCYTGDDIWYDHENIVDTFFKEIIEYEHSLPVEEIEYQEFDRW